MIRAGRKHSLKSQNDTFLKTIHSGGKVSFMSRRKKLVNHTNIPQPVIEAIARCLYTDILTFHESEEGQREFAEWKNQREAKKQEIKTE